MVLSDGLSQNGLHGTWEPKMGIMSVENLNLIIFVYYTPISIKLYKKSILAKIPNTARKLFLWHLAPH